MKRLMMDSQSSAGTSIPLFVVVRCFWCNERYTTEHERRRYTSIYGRGASSHDHPAENSDGPDRQAAMSERAESAARLLETSFAALRRPGRSIRPCRRTSTPSTALFARKEVSSSDLFSCDFPVFIYIGLSCIGPGALSRSGSSLICASYDDTNKPSRAVVAFLWTTWKTLV